MGLVEFLLVPEFGDLGSIGHELKFFPAAPQHEPTGGRAVLPARVPAQAAQHQVELVLGPVGTGVVMTPQRQHFDVFLVDLFARRTGAGLRASTRAMHAGCCPRG